MEDFLLKEMSLLELDNPKGPPFEAQLEVYRQCLTLFMQSFKTYAPILSKIIACYEAALSDHSKGSASVEHPSVWEAEYTSLQLSLRVENLVDENKQLLKSLSEWTERATALQAKAEELRAANTTLEAAKREDYRRIVMLIAAVKEAEDRASEANHELHLLKCEVHDKGLNEAPKPKRKSTLASEDSQVIELVPRAEYDRLKAEFLTSRSHIFELERTHACLRENLNTMRLDYEEKLLEVRNVILAKKVRTALEDEVLRICGS